MKKNMIKLISEDYDEVEDTIEYHEYKVSEDLLVECYVTKGKVAPKFLSQGGAIQFMHKHRICGRECARKRTGSKNQQT